MSLADPYLGDYSAGGPGIPEDFRADVVKALWNKGIDVAAVGATLDTLVQKLWSNPYLQDAYTNRLTIDPQYGSISGQISNQLFGLTTSTDSNLLTAGLNLEVQSGQTLSSAEQNYLAGGSGGYDAAGGAEAIPAPFASQFGYVSGNDYGDIVDPNSMSGAYGVDPATGLDQHWGVDYGTPAGTQISAPFAGTVTVQNNVPLYGNLVTLTFGNGYQLRFGHVASGVRSGPVQPGDIIAISGANVGNSSGAVTLVELRDPQGNHLNPHDILDPIFKGTATFASLFDKLGTAIAGGGRSYDASLDAQYPGIASAWRKYTGEAPTPAEIGRILQALGPNPSAQQMEDFVRAMGSHIGGLTSGQYSDLRSLADSVSQKLLGHPATDAVVKMLFDKGLVTPAAVNLWYGDHSPNSMGIPPAAYNQIYAANTPTLKGIFNDPGFDPRIAQVQWQARQAATAAAGAPQTEGIKADLYTPPASDSVTAADSLSSWSDIINTAAVDGSGIPLTPPPPGSPGDPAVLRSGAQ